MGPQTLFAALEVASGLVQTGHHARRRRREFLDFMKDILAAIPTPSRSSTLLGKFTPTDASWLNQVEVWYSILQRAALRGAGHTAPRQGARGDPAVRHGVQRDRRHLRLAGREVRQVTHSNHADLRN